MNTIYVIMHLLREHRKRNRLTQPAMTESLSRFGVHLTGNHYGHAERNPERARTLDSPAFRNAAASVLGCSPGTLESTPVRLPNPCLYCHYVPRSTPCVCCRRVDHQRRS